MELLAQKHKLLGQAVSGVSEDMAIGPQVAVVQMAGGSYGGGRMTDGAVTSILSGIKEHPRRSWKNTAGRSALRTASSGYRKTLTISASARSTTGRMTRSGSMCSSA